jgi:hypothetical protein
MLLKIETGVKKKTGYSNLKSFGQIKKSFATLVVEMVG